MRISLELLDFLIELRSYDAFIIINIQQTYVRLSTVHITLLEMWK